MTDSLVTSSVADGVGTIALNRPQALNPWNLGTAQQFLRAMAQRHVTAVVLALGLSACTPASSPSLEGAWRVLQVELIGPDGAVTVLPHQESLFLFTGDHYSMVYAFGEAPSPPYAERWRPSAEEKLARFSSTIVNGGSYRISGDRIVARPAVAAAPEFVNGEGRFRVRFVADTLELTWDESIAFDGLPYPSGGTITRIRLVRIQ
jgi:hypothetical protein